jgi:hypothetical protein
LEEKIDKNFNRSINGTRGDAASIITLSLKESQLKSLL